MYCYVIPFGYGGLSSLENSVALAKEYTQKGLEISRTYMVPHI